MNLTEFLLKISKQSLISVHVCSADAATLNPDEQKKGTSGLFGLRLFQVTPYTRNLEGIIPSGIRAEDNFQ